MITSLNEFVARVRALDDVGDAYDVFEFDTAEHVRDAVYALADPQDPEPFRDAMHTLGFTDY